MADRLSLKWVEGNTNATVAEITDETTFNVDDPTFWTPLSVLSGLASGYCERRAVLNNAFITGTTTQGGVTTNIETTWDQESTAPADSAARAKIVSNFMNNIALGSTGDDVIYKAADATMHTFGTVAGSSYMTAMDSAITTLVSGPVHYVKNENNTAVDYGATGQAAFGGVAVAANATANENDSSIQPPQFGGGQLKSVMAIGLPAEWAKERKWMLDELRWTAAEVTELTPIVSAVPFSAFTCWRNTGVSVYFVPLFCAMSAFSGYCFSAPLNTVPFASHSIA